MRKAKDNSHVPTRYFRPAFESCPACGAPLRRRATVQDKIVITLKGRWPLISRGYGGSRPRCLNARATLVSPAPARLRLKGLSFGFDGIVQIGWGRFWEPRTLAEIWDLARQRFPLSRRQVMDLIVDFLCLLKAAQPARSEVHRKLYEQRGLLLSVDARQPEKGNDALSVVRELRTPWTLRAVKVTTQRRTTSRAQVLKPVDRLGFRTRGVVSDAEEASQGGGPELWPGCPPQACPFQAFRAAGRPLVEADQHGRVTIKQA